MVKLTDKAEKLIEEIKTRTAAGEKITVDELKRMAGSLSAADPNIGKPTEVRLLYNGGLEPLGDGSGLANPKGLQAWQPVDFMANEARGSILTVNHTDAGRFLNDPVFRKTMLAAVGGPEKIDDYLKVMHGERLPNGMRTLGLWDEVSARFVRENAHLPTRILAPFPTRQGVLIVSEVPAMLEMPKGGLIENVDRPSFISMAKDTPGGISDLRHAIGALSKESSAGFIYNLGDDRTITGIASQAFFKKDFAHLGQSVSFPSQGTSVTQVDLFTKLDAAARDETVQGVKILEKAGYGNMLSFTKDFGKSSGMITGAVVGAGVAGFSYVMGATPAQAAETFYQTAVPYGETQIDLLVKQDPKAAARSGLVETVSNITGAVGCVVGGAGAGAAGSVVPVAGTTAGAITGCVVVGGAAGYAGGEAAGYAFDHYDAAKGYTLQKIDAAGKVISNAYGDIKTFFTGEAEPRYTWQEVYNALPVNIYDGMQDKDRLNPTKLDVLLQPEAQALGIIKKQIEALKAVDAQGTLARQEELKGQFISTYDQYSADRNALGHLETYVDLRRAELEEHERQRQLEEELQRRIRDAALNNPPGGSFDSSPKAGMSLAMSAP